MLERPSRLPRKFNRRVSGVTRTFVERRHKRQKQYMRERWKRFVRRVQRIFLAGVISLRQWLWIACALAVLIGIGTLVFSPSMHVREIRVKRTDARLDADRIQQTLRPIFGRHLFFLSAREVQARVRAAMPDVQDVTVEKHYPSELVLSVTLHPLAARLSIEGGTAPASSGGAATFDFLTDNGLYVALPSAESGTVLPTIHVVDWAAYPVPLMPLFSPDLLKRMGDAENALTQQFGLKILSRTMFVRAREFHLQTKTFSVWFDLSTPLAEQLGRYRTFLKSATASDIHQYIDLRITGRVVYK